MALKNPSYYRIKRVIDITLASLLFVAILPLLLLIYVLIYLAGGKPIYTQERVGLHRAPFKIYKFRTMIIDADKYLDDSGMPTKPRVTRLGKWLRLSSLDELPQLVNIINGTMSIIGPRPVLVGWDNKFKGEQLIRFNVRPGVTGLAQINGRNDLPWSRRLEFDRKYVEEISLKLDAKILCLTFASVIKRKNIAADRNSDKVNDL